MVSTLDFESSDPSSNLGRTCLLFSAISRLWHSRFSLLIECSAIFCPLTMQLTHPCSSLDVRLTNPPYIALCYMRYHASVADRDRSEKRRDCATTTGTRKYYQYMPSLSKAPPRRPPIFPPQCLLVYFSNITQGDNETIK